MLCSAVALGCGIADERPTQTHPGVTLSDAPLFDVTVNPTPDGTASPSREESIGPLLDQGGEVEDCLVSGADVVVDESTATAEAILTLSGDCEGTISLDYAVETPSAPMAEVEVAAEPLYNPTGSEYVHTRLRARDFDGDGDIDLAASLDVDIASSSQLVWYENVGDDGLSFQRHTIETFYPGILDLEVIDIDGDGVRELITVQVPSWLWGAQKHLIVYDLSGEHIELDIDGEHFEFADMDHDGDVDIVYLTPLLYQEPQAANISWMENNGDGTFSTEHPMAGCLVDTFYFDLGDINGDSSIDVITSSWIFGNHNWCRSNDDGTFTVIEQPAFGDTINGITYADEPLAATLKDLNGDGHLDFISHSNNALSSGMLHWYESDGQPTPTFERHILASFPYTGNDDEDAIDLNDDGYLDLLVSPGGYVLQNPLEVYLNVGVEPLRYESIFIAHTSDLLDREFADITGDGAPDLIAAARGEQGIWIWENHLTMFADGPLAVGGADYEPQAGVLNLSTEESSASITVPIIDDDSAEEDERVLIHLSSTDDVTLETQTITLTIQDND